MPTLGDRVAERYELLSELGHGGGATVYLAHDSRVGGEVALKIVAASGQSFQLLEARIEREARLSYRLGQLPGIVRALDYGVLEPGQSLYLALDLVRGAQPLDLRSGTLAERLERVAQAAEIVKRLHERKVIHRDLKPDNFLVSEEGELFLADFGIAKRVGEETPASGGMRTATGALLGTPMFMAMEQFESAASASYAADLYSLGVMLFYALTGRFPFEGTNAVEVMSAQLEVRYRQRVPPRPGQLDPSVDPDLDRLCAFAIDIDPKKRPAQIPLFVRSLRLAVDRLRGSSERRAAVPQRDPKTLSASGKRSALVIPRDEEGFASLRELRSLQEQLGPERFEALLDGSPALIVEHERPLEGVANYQDRVAVLPSGALGAPMFIGRSKSRCDVVLALPTISNPQVRIERVENGWEIRDLGSRNGTELNGSPLRPNEGRPLSSGDQFCLSRHVRLKFLFASGLSEHLLWTG